MSCKMVIVYIFMCVLYRACFGTMEGNIVGGTDAKIEDWPFIAFIMYSVGEKMVTGCGSSLISSQTLLTAAHCLDDVTLYKSKLHNYNVTALMGHSHMHKATMIREVVDYQTHFKYNVEDSLGDLGVAFLDRPVKFSHVVKKVLLKTQPIDYKNDRNLLIAGWGVWSDPVNLTHVTSETLQYLHQTLIPRKVCESYIDSLEPGTICAGRFNFSKYVFSGDSGGPLVTYHAVQVGIVSYKKEGHNGVTVYTNVASYINWIKQTQEQLFDKNCGHNSNKKSNFRRSVIEGN